MELSSPRASDESTNQMDGIRMNQPGPESRRDGSQDISRETERRRGKQILVCFDMCI